MNWKYEDGRIYCTDEHGVLICETTFVRVNNGEINIDYTYVENDTIISQTVLTFLKKFMI